MMFTLGGELETVDVGEREAVEVGVVAGIMTGGGVAGGGFRAGN
ncbi:MAG: hypothetical protein Q8P66_01040 [Candidatus Colwellbacteria bacterium]|nr:hypothetical protein [Candidatus Colwellbacteria bacterium]